MACTMFILLWVQDELSYDRFHENANDIYRVESELHLPNAIQKVPATPALLAPALKEGFPEVINSTRVKSYEKVQIKADAGSFFEKEFCFVDRSLLEMFSFPLLKGSPNDVLSAPFSLVISEEIAERYFGNTEPIGQILNVENRFDFTVTGILKNIPQNSTLQFSFLTPFETLTRFDERLDDWGRLDFDTYVLLKKNTSFREVNQKISGYVQKHKPTITLYLQPLTRIHLHSYEGNEGIVRVFVFSSVAVIVLLVACINFINLTTARSNDRAKEVGLRKVVGAHRMHLVTQFLGEASLLSFVACMFAIILVEMLVPFFSNLTGKEFTLNNIYIFCGLIGITFIAGAVSGSYPALFLSSFQPIAVLKGTARSGSIGSLFKKMLIVIQFSISIILIISTIVIYKQLNYIRNKNLGYNRDYMVYMPINRELRQEYESLKSTLLQNPNIISVTATSALPLYMANSTVVDGWEGKQSNETFIINTASVDYNFIETFGIQIIQGRNFSKEFSTDRLEAYIVNEEAAKVMGLESSIGKQFSIWGMKGRIIGVMKNFHFRSLHRKIEPLVLMVSHNQYNYTCINTRTNNIFNTMRFVESCWNRFAPNYPLEYSFLDEALNNLYRTEQRTGIIFSCFTILAVLISALGLFGLATYMVESRVKEIGIRKVLGASVSRVVIVLLSKNYNNREDFYTS
jgi:hypothetical protein